MKNASHPINRFLFLIFEICISRVKQNQSSCMKRKVWVKCARVILPFALSISSRIFMIRTNDIWRARRYIHIFLTELNGASSDLSAINDRSAPVEDLPVIRFVREADISPNGAGLFSCPAIAETLSLSAIRFRQRISEAFRPHVIAQG